MAAGIELAGRILLDGVDVSGMPPHRRNVNTVFQSYALFPFLSVFDNVAFGLRHAHVAKADLRKRVGDALALVSMSSFASRRHAQLSGGQQQRVALARALVLNPAPLCCCSTSRSGRSTPSCAAGLLTGGAGPVPGRRPQHAELVAVRIGEDVPGPAVLLDSFRGEPGRPECHDSVHLRVQVTGAQVEVDAVLGALAVVRALEQDLDTRTVRGQQAPVLPAAVTLVGIAERPGPEARGPVQIRAVDYDDQMATCVGIRLPGHRAIVGPLPAECLRRATGYR
jgi:hypothetical protein